MMVNQPKTRYRASTHNTRKVERSAFGKLLHEEFLTPHKVTQRRLSEVSGVAAEDISRMVTGERYPYDPTLYNNLYALFKALAELGVPLTDVQVSNILQVQEIHARLSDTRQTELVDALQDEGVVKKVADQTTQQDADALNLAVAQPQLPIDNLPFQRNPFFTGREEHLDRLLKELQETGTAAITQPVSISGLGGIGKTELALEYAHRFYPDLYHTALWVNAADDEMLRASYVELAKTLNLLEQDEYELYASTLHVRNRHNKTSLKSDARPQETEAHPAISHWKQIEERCIQAVKKWLKTHTNWLLIMDNADDLPLAESFLPSQPRGHVIFTTQSHIIDTTATRSKHIEVEEMKSDDCLLLLLLRSYALEDKTKLDTVSTDICEQARKVVKLLGGHPLALDQAGAYIQATGLSFTDYVKRYHKERRRLLNRRRSLKSKDSEHSRHPLSVAATLELSIKEACEGQSLASDILHFCAWPSFHHAAIPENLFQYDDGFKYGTTEFDHAIEALLRYSLIKRNGQDQTLSLHGLVQAALIDNMSSDVQYQWTQRVVGAQIRSLPRVPPPRDLYVKILRGIGLDAEADAKAAELELDDEPSE